MKTKITLFLAIALVAISVIIIYKEAAARPMLCDTMAENCSYCNGDFFILNCEDFGGGLIYCWFECYFPPPGDLYPFPCPWCSSPVYGDCVL